MTEKKYIVIGGKIRCKSDGQMHYVHANELCRLYGVDPNECHLLESIDKHLSQKMTSLPQFMITLKPLESGEYAEFMETVHTFDRKKRAF